MPPKAADLGKEGELCHSPTNISPGAVLPQPYLVGTGKSCPQLCQQPDHPFAAVAFHWEIGLDSGQGLQETQVFLHDVPEVCHEEGLLLALGDSWSEQQLQECLFAKAEAEEQPSPLGTAPPAGSPGGLWW